jgi:hypothetical protein
MFLRVITYKTMNRIFKSTWRETTRTFVAIAEVSKGKGKHPRSRRVLAQGIGSVAGSGAVGGAVSVLPVALMASGNAWGYAVAGGSDNATGSSSAGNAKAAIGKGATTCLIPNSGTGGTAYGRTFMRGFKPASAPARPHMNS